MVREGRIGQNGFDAKCSIRELNTAILKGGQGKIEQNGFDEKCRRKVYDMKDGLSRNGLTRNVQRDAMPAFENPSARPAIAVIKDFRTDILYRMNLMRCVQ